VRLHSASAAKKAGKPLVLEEFGLFGYGKPPIDDRLHSRLVSLLENKTVIFKEWVDHALKTNHA